MNKKNVELNSIKIDCQRLEEDNNRNLKVIESIINEYGKEIMENILSNLDNNTYNNTNTNTCINPYNETSNNANKNSTNNIHNNQSNNNIPRNENLEAKIINENESKEIIEQEKINKNNVNLSVKSLIRLREVYVINTLKKQLSSMKNTMKKKDEEIEEYKKNIKCAKYSKLEFNYNTNLTSFAKTKKDNENVRKLCSELTEKYLKEKEENEKINLLFIKQKNHLDEIKQKLKSFEEENIKLNEKCKAMEERINFLNTYANAPTSHQTRMTIRKQEKMILNYREELDSLNENYKKEKQRLERRIYYMDKDYKELKKIYE